MKFAKMDTQTAAFMTAAVFAAVILAVSASAQCVDHRDRETSLKFVNESRFELTFFLDDDEEGVVVPAKSSSVSIRVDPGEHLLRARARVNGKSVWVWVVNDVPPGKICTWTVEDPTQEERELSTTAEL